MNQNTTMVKFYSREEGTGILKGTRVPVLELDGRELKDVRSFKIEASVDDAVACTIEMFVGPDSVIEIPADVTVNVIGTQGQEVTSERDGRVFRVTSRAADAPVDR